MYFSREMQNHHGGVLLYNGHLYGSSNAILTCLEWITGKAKWRDRAVGKGSITGCRRCTSICLEKTTQWDWLRPHRMDIARKAASP